MGCTQSDVRYTADSLKTQAKRVHFSCDLHKQRVSQELIKLQKNLCKWISKDVRNRSRQMERAIIRGNTSLHNQRLSTKCTISVYCRLQNQCSRIIQQHTSLNSEQELVKIKPSLNILQYCAEFMNFDELNRFDEMLRYKYPNFSHPTDAEITDEILKSEKCKSPTFTSEMEYVFQFSLNYGIPMERINEVGHSYRYGAIKYEG